jgi:dihydropteroate synthase
MAAPTLHSRPPFDWRLRTRTLPLGRHTVLMGILNLTPDSFSDGGHFFTPQQPPQRAVDRALLLLDQGADILDLGGESTRPNATPVSPDEEQSRVLPTLEAILQHRPDAILSIDTYHAATARRAVEAGAEIVNDVSGLTWDAGGHAGAPNMAATCTQLHCGAILMHTRGRPQQWPTLPALPKADILPLVLAGLRHSLALARTAGIATDQIVLDPGFGFGKMGTENYTLLAHLSELHQLGHPLLSGISRKGFLAKTLAHLYDEKKQDQKDSSPSHAPADIPMEARLHATQAANVASILAGAHILRVHDIPATRESAAIADAVLAAAATSTH